ncbi:PAP2 superfamily-domain-containing protein [Daldinia caldariorum]|uniref:PAP2 superfamily-domain-containing protein n=1 Tax=Daldinia caldariorum TaxID=326644 RepID=UPI002008EB5A|nr:PAP2 superfamily-domain-containing protein [Daldinia caldariorum]KAI1471095.1 PAP2 superfamily-domain-containing protein [Daldinia caldariorum]
MNITNSVHANGGAGPIKKDIEVTEEKPPVIDAGLRNLDHYKRALPKWRYELRQRALPLVRWETPYLAWLQATLRSPALDSYFAITANLGTHTFFMIGLPIMFWCGNASFGKGIVHILATGVFFTGFVKDFFSLPRPLSPPLHRITMSGSAALEYGFPSTHSANAVSVAVYAILCLHDPDNPFQPATRSTLEALAYFYAISIVFGRLYCGMHGFVDVIIGSLMGAIISLVEFYGGPALDLYLGQSWVSLCGLLLIIIILIRVHPEPADDCPCFDDSVAFAGVMMGLEIGTWRFGRSSWADIPFDAAALGWAAVGLRIVFGVLVIFAWREVAKPSLLKGLPHLFRLIEVWGLSLPRRFFMPASEYKNIPLRLRVDNVMPNVSDLPNLLTAVRHPGRGRSVSVGPQSAADAYETLAYRERRRRESVSVGAGNNANANNSNLAAPGSAALRNRASVQDIKEQQQQQQQKENDNARSSAVSNSNGAQQYNQQQQQHNQRNHHHYTPSDFEELMGQGTVVVSPAETGGEPDLIVGQHDELGEKEVFSKLVKPRVRYDVEVVTKLVVYCGIGWLAVEFIPVLYEIIPGLGAGHLRVA